MFCSNNAFVCLMICIFSARVLQVIGTLTHIIRLSFMNRVFKDTIQVLNFLIIIELVHIRSWIVTIKSLVNFYGFHHFLLSSLKSFV